MEKMEELYDIGNCLLAVYPDKKFVKEVLTHLETEEEILGMKDILFKSPEIVPSEVYDALIGLKKGNYEFSFCEARSKKRQYIQEPTADNMNSLLDQLEKDGLVYLEKWDITKEEEDLFIESNIGNTVTIETTPEPFFYMTEEKNKILIPVYTSSLEILNERRKVFSTTTVPFSRVRKLQEAIKTVMNIETVLLLDFDSDDRVDIKEEAIEAWKQKRQ